MDIAKKIVQARKEKGFTQESLADAANLSLSTIKRIENRKVKPHPHTLIVLSDILGLNLLHHQPNSNSTNQNTLVILTISILLSLIPPINLLFLLILFYRKKHPFFFNFIGNKFLVVQILSFVFLILSIILVSLFSVMLTGQKVYGQFNFVFVLYLIYVLTNIIITLVLYKVAQKQKRPINDT